MLLFILVILCHPMPKTTTPPCFAKSCFIYSFQNDWVNNFEGVQKRINTTNPRITCKSLAK
ncbi:hypothetical protein PR003_g25582 [Phytophthora rubi]|uniref:Uncharacterized protein n=1 Tax=Phytophthora rubi TaxID=129364 RepID=A0A6A3I9H8_9STRA|nr:hypothetical protein PR001_g24483 [Phytophthora rubi]KAE9289329.1 hypothetical protein PR003_g25582 [Phytophthora rubi]